MKIDDDAIEEFLSTHPGWERDGETISKTYERSDFQETIGFVVRLAFLAEAADHHPDIDIRWKRVTLSLTTHEAGALTQRDLDLARQIESIAG